MCKNCGRKISDKAVQYQCQCQEGECDCAVIEFDEEPKATPYCCGKEMKRIK